MKNVYFSFLAFLLVAEGYSQTGITTNYPLKSGNIFVFKKHTEYSPPPMSSTTYHTSRILNDTIINLKNYHKVFNYPVYGNFVNGFLRVDTINGNLYFYDTLSSCSVFKERIIDSLWAGLDNFNISCRQTPAVCTDTNTYSLFNIPSQTKSFYESFYCPNCSESDQRRYAKGFGFYYYYYSYSRTSYATITINLKGCVIDGTLFGDTTLPVGIVNNLARLPLKFTLIQNYPNPFNPKTKIKFELLKRSTVDLIVYDIAGKEITKLIRGEFYNTSGEYEVNFDAGEFDLSTGAYFYTMKAQTEDKREIFIETKKMILIK